MGKVIKIPKILKGDYRLERSLDVRLIGQMNVDSVYTDLDDCLIVRGMVNTQLIAFLYGCRNKGLPIILVTRHRGNLETVLRKFKLSGLFDRIFHLKNGESKHTVISHQMPLFIDDSFTERDSIRVIPSANAIAPDMVDISMISEKGLG